MYPVFFSDFDGTITEKDVIISIMEEFAPPKWKYIHNSLLSGEIDIDVGIRMMFNLIPSKLSKQIVHWCRENVKVKQGFDDFLEFLDEIKIPFIIISGGVDLYIYPVLEKYLAKIHRIYSNRILLDKEFMDVNFVYRCANYCMKSCEVCKPYVIEKYYKNFNPKFYAGDGITDLDACQFNDIIFSAGGLYTYLKNRKLKGKKIVRFETFYDIIKALKEYGEGFYKG